MENRIVLEGTVSSAPLTRFSPAGIPIARFHLDHVSHQQEAGHERQAKCRIGVVAAGKGLQRIAESLQVESYVRVHGFLSSAGYRAGEYRLVLHAQQIEQLPGAAS